MMHTTLWPEVQHFKQPEFDSKDRPGSGQNMHPRVVFMLDALRGLVGKAFVINSGFRTPEHNKVVGGAPASGHLSGEAVDVRTLGWTKKQRQDLVLYARMLGFTGVGIASTFIHLDIKPRKATWIYRGGKTIPVAIVDELKYV